MKAPARPQSALTPTASIGCHPPNAARGMTLLEMTVVILVLLGLISILFFATQAWKNGSDRTLCIVNIQAVQKAVRSYSNMYAYSPGETVPGLQGKIIGLGRFIENTPICPGGGEYSFGADSGIDTIPPIGTAYMECSLSDSNEHEPKDTTEW